MAQALRSHGPDVYAYLRSLRGAKESTNALPGRREWYAQWSMSPHKYLLVFQAAICPAGLSRIAVGVGP
jgi:hypothetical protein